MDFNVKTHIRGQSVFQYYKENTLWYKTNDTNLLFSVPIDDCGSAQFMDIEKSMLMMRYIRKYLAEMQND